jgi:D-alanyl-D-alanine carboxypeptidase (penicillin-binding protein 5/6)
MGMTHTHFADPSGFSPQTMSTASDLVLLAKAVVAEPVLATFVSEQFWDLPDGTTVRNLDLMLGQAGWLGIKTGWSPAAGGCFLFAEQKIYAVDAKPVTVYGAVLGQPPDGSVDVDHPELGGAFAAAQAGADAELSGYGAVNLAANPPNATGTISTPWGDSVDVNVTPPPRLDLTLRKGTQLRVTLHVSRVLIPLPQGTPVGSLTGTLGSAVVVTWSLVAADTIHEPQWWWKLLNA